MAQSPDLMVLSRRRFAPAFFLALSLVCTACATGSDAGPGAPDSGQQQWDAGHSSPDGSPATVDARPVADGSPATVDGSPASDGSPAFVDARPAPTDATPGPTDAGPPDAGTPPACFVAPLCDATPPAPGAAAGFRNSASTLKSLTGVANHKVHDLLLAPGDPQWVIGTVAYDSIVTSALEDEDVDVFLLRGCGGQWELLGTATTTKSGEHTTVEGVEDTGGRVYFAIPAAQALGLGRHRIHLVVKGNATTADGFIEVQPYGIPVFISDIDGTLTTSDLAEFGGVLTNTTPDANPNAAAALGQLVAAGYRPVYLTARTETELARTRVFLDVRGFPPGPVRTTNGNGLIGPTGSAAVTFKTGEIQLLKEHGFNVLLGIGNTNTDAQAYQQENVGKSFIFATNAGEPYGGREFDAYKDLVGLAGLPALCAAQ